MGFILLHCVPFKIPSLDTILNEFHPGRTLFLLRSILILSTNSSNLRCAFHQVFLLKF